MTVIVTVDGNKEDRRICSEDLMSSVSAMNVPIQNSNLFDTILLLQVSGSDSYIVENAKSV